MYITVTTAKFTVRNDRAAPFGASRYAAATYSTVNMPVNLFIHISLLNHLTKYSRARRTEKNSLY